MRARGIDDSVWGWMGAQVDHALRVCIHPRCGEVRWERGILTEPCKQVPDVHRVFAREFLVEDFRIVGLTEETWIGTAQGLELFPFSAIDGCSEDLAADEVTWADGLKPQETLQRKPPVLSASRSRRFCDNSGRMLVIRIHDKPFKTKPFCSVKLLPCVGDGHRTVLIGDSTRQ